MKRALLFVGAWLAATAVTGVVAWAGVRLAGERTGDEALIPMSSQQVAALAAAATTTTSAPSSTAAPTTTTPYATTTTTGPAVVAHRVRGGTLVVSLEGGTLSLVGATPAPGFSVEVEEAGPAEVLVVFGSDEEEMEVRAFVAGGEVAFLVSGDG